MEEYATFLAVKGLGRLYPTCEDRLSFAVIVAEFWSLENKCGSQRTNRVRRTLGVACIDGSAR